MSGETNLSGEIIEENKNKASKDSENKEFDDSFYPWIKPNGKCHSLHGMLKLHYEILDFYDFIKLTNSEIRARNKTYKEIKTIIEDNFPNYKCSLYGSFITELSLPDSDIDILITKKEEKNNNPLKPDKNEQNEETILLNDLESVYSVLGNKNIFKDFKIIHAKVPIVTGIYNPTDVHVDISFCKKKGINDTEIIKNILNIYPEIKPLMLLIKYLIRQRNLNQIYTGGISSFIIFSLIYYYIADLRKQIEYKINNGEKEQLLTLGHLLVGFFNFYAFEFNYEKFGISISKGCYLYERNDGSKKNLSIKNFEDESYDMGANCYHYSKILDIFKLAAERLNYSEKNVVSYLKEFIFPDDTLKKRANMFNNDS